MKTVFDIGERFGSLTVVDELPMGPRSNRRYLVRCSCGTEKAVYGCKLRPGGTLSCGCYNRQAVIARNLTHGEARNGKSTAEYACWLQMKQRCLNPRSDRFKHYGGRGIKVCDRWLDSYANFFADMGRKLSAKHSIDRINNDGNYEPSNCRWATTSEQNFNQRRSLASRE